jgi:hypothetical protein
MIGAGASFNTSVLSPMYHLIRIQKRELLRQLFIKIWLCGLCSGNSSLKFLALRALLLQLFIKNFGFAGSAPATLH